MTDANTPPDELSYEEVHGHSLPDELSYEQVHGRPLPNAPVSWGDWIADAGKSLGSGVVKGTAALPGIGGDIEQLGYAAARGLGYNPGEGTYLPSSQDTQKWASEHIPHAREAIDYKPQTTAGKYAQTIGEFAPAVLTGPTKSLVTAGRAAVAPTARKLVTQAVVPAVASEGAGQLTEGTWLEPAARVAGAVAGHGAASLAEGIAGTREGARSAVRNATGNVTAADLDAMDNLMSAARARGIDLTRAEALQQVTGGKTTLPDLQRVAEGRGAMAPFFAQRPQQIEGATNAMLDTIAPRSAAPEQLGQAAGKAARQEMREAEHAVTKAANPYYEAANPVRVPDTAVDNAIEHLDRLKSADTTGLTHGELDRLSRQLSGSRDIENLDRIRKNLRDRLGLPAGSADALDKETYAKLNKAMEPVTKAMDAASPDYIKAREVYQTAQRQIVDPLKAGPLGRLARKDPTTQDVFNALFPKKPVAGSEGAIEDAVTRLASKNPNAARQLVRAYLDTEFSAARKMMLSGQSGAKFAEAVAGHPQQAANLHAAIGALHGPEVSEGVKDFFDILHATGQRQGAGSKVAQDIATLEQLGSGNPVTEAVATLGTGIPRTLRDRFTRWAQGANTEELSKLLTDPRSASQFRTLALAEPDSASWRSAIKSLIALAGREGARVTAQTAAHDTREPRAAGGKVDALDRAANRARSSISEDTRRLMSAPDEAIAAALRIANGGR